MTCMQILSSGAISDCEIELQENDLRQVLEVECGGVSLVALQRSSDSQDKLISALLEVNPDGIYTHARTHTHTTEATR